MEGRAMLERELGRLSLGFPDADALDELALETNHESGEDLLAAIGFGDIGAHTTAARLQKALAPEPEPPAVAPSPGPKKRPKTAAGVSVDGIGGVLSQPARCCKPVPGDPVVGYITRGRGIMIHHRECPNILRTREPERLVDVDWGGDSRRAYPVTFRVQLHDRPGAFRDVAEVVSSLGINITASQTRSRTRDDSADVTLTLEIRESREVQQVLERLSRLEVVLNARRIDR